MGKSVLTLFGYIYEKETEHESYEKRTTDRPADRDDPTGDHWLHCR